MENIVLHLKLMREVRGISLASVVSQHVKMAHVLPGYHAYLNLDKEVIARVPIVNAKSNLKQTQECLDNAHVSWKCDIFKINNALVYHILSKIFIEWIHMYTQNRVRVCRTVKLHSSTSISDFLVMTMWPGRLQKQEKAAKLSL